MKNSLVDLQNHLFEMIETLNDQNLKGEELEREIKRSLTINELAKTAVTNGALMVKALDVLETLDYKPAMEGMPLLPIKPSEDNKGDGKIKYLTSKRAG